MTVKKKNEENDQVLDELRYAIISKGGSVTDDVLTEQDWKKITLRISSEMLKKIKTALTQRPGLTRNAWILEAIHEKINRDGKD